MSFQKLIAWLLGVAILSSVSAFTPEIVEINHRIGQLQHRNRQLSALRNGSKALPHPQSGPVLPKYSSGQMRLNSRCIHSGAGVSGFLFQTVANVYFALNHPQTNSLHFYNHRCEQLSVLEGVQLQEVLCDRGVCQSGTLHFLSADQRLYSACEEKNFSAVTQLANLEGQEIVGGVIRNRGKDKIEIYLASGMGAVRVLDESGVGKLRLEVEGFNSRLAAVRDHHPYPILLMQASWISLLDTVKYAELPPNCPHIPQLRALLPENYYGQAAYALTPTRIYLLDFEISKRNCVIKREYELEAPLESVSSLSFFANTLFIDNRVYNLTERRMYTLDEECGSAALVFLLKKGQGEEVYALKRCCRGGECSVELLEVRKLTEDRSILFWLTIAFIAILFLSLSFMKKSNVNNLDLDDPAKLREREVQQQIMALTHQAKTAKEKEKKSAIKPAKKQS